MQFTRLKQYLIDLEQMYLVNTTSGKVYQFDFGNMTVTNRSTPTKTKAPIRYDEDQDTILVWRCGSWKKIPDGPEAALLMFNHKVERQLLDG